MQAVLTFLSSIRNRPVWIVAALAIIEIALLMLGPDVAEAKAKIATKPDDVPWEADADLGLHLAAMLNLGLLVVLALTTRWWARGFSDQAQTSAERKSVTKPKAAWFWPLVLVAVVMSTALRLPLASRSLWWDECWVIRPVSYTHLTLPTKRIV